LNSAIARLTSQWAGMLHEFITTHRADIIGRCRAKVALRSPPPPTHPEIDHGVPVFLGQLVDALRFDLPSSDIARTAALHGHDLLLRGLTVSQVVHDYGDVCQAITELAMETDSDISMADFRTLNRCLDDAIAGAVTEYGREEMQSHDGAVDTDTDRIGNSARALRASINAANIALEAVTSGSVGLAGSTGTVLRQSLSGASVLTERLLSEIHASRRPFDSFRQSPPKLR
jgi:hypothetical protein